MSDTRPIEVGDRFASKDERDAGKVIEIRQKLEKPGTLGDRFLAQTEVHPRNPFAVGRHSTVSEYTLRHRYERISR